jgi:hypothetical protein
VDDKERIKEDGLLRAHGFHLAYDPEDAAEYPREYAVRGEVWQLGPDKDNVFTRAEALESIRGQREEREQND